MKCKHLWIFFIYYCLQENDEEDEETYKEENELVIVLKYNLETYYNYII